MRFEILQHNQRVDNTEIKVWLAPPTNFCIRFWNLLQIHKCHLPQCYFYVRILYTSKHNDDHQIQAGNSNMRYSGRTTNQFQEIFHSYTILRFFGIGYLHKWQNPHANSFSYFTLHSLFRIRDRPRRQTLMLFTVKLLIKTIPLLPK